MDLIRKAPVNQFLTQKKFWLSIALACSSCGSGSGGSSGAFVFATCAFEGKVAGCEPIDTDGMTRTSWEAAFNVINPKIGPACAGDVKVSANSASSGPGKFSWDAHELDSQKQCAQVGGAITGLRPVSVPLTQDVYFPNGDFSFRLHLRAPK